MVELITEREGEGGREVGKERASERASERHRDRDRERDRQTDRARESEKSKQYTAGKIRKARRLRDKGGKIFSTSLRLFCDSGRGSGELKSFSLSLPPSLFPSLPPSLPPPPPSPFPPPLSPSLTLSQDGSKETFTFEIRVSDGAAQVAVVHVWSMGEGASGERGGERCHRSKRFRLQRIHPCA